MIKTKYQKQEILAVIFGYIKGKIGVDLADQYNTYYVV